MNVNSFLACETPEKWLDAVPDQIQTLLIDHANCEKKAASTALNLLYRYVDKPELMLRLSKLAREELRHFEQVLAIMKDRKMSYEHVSPGRYASTLHSHINCKSTTSNVTRTVRPNGLTSHLIYLLGADDGDDDV